MNALIRTLTIITLATAITACEKVELEPTSTSTNQTAVTTENTAAVTPEEEVIETETAEEQITTETEEEVITEETAEEVAEEIIEEEVAEETEPETRNITLSWTPPSTRANGDALELSEIDGYEIYYFMDGSPDGEGETNAINSPNITEFAIDDLVPGVYYFSIAAIDTDGLVSEMSEAIEADLQ